MPSRNTASTAAFIISNVSMNRGMRSQVNVSFVMTLRPYTWPAEEASLRWTVFTSYLSFAPNVSPSG